MLLFFLFNILLSTLHVHYQLSVYLFFLSNTYSIGRLARMSVLDTEVDGSNPGSSMLFP